MHSLDIHRSGGILIGHGQIRWCPAWIYDHVVFRVDMGRRDVYSLDIGTRVGIFGVDMGRKGDKLTGHGQ